jgi:hypothetical protein
LLRRQRAVRPFDPMTARGWINTLQLKSPDPNSNIPSPLEGQGYRI